MKTSDLDLRYEKAQWTPKGTCKDCTHAEEGICYKDGKQSEVAGTGSCGAFKQR